MQRAEATSKLSSNEKGRWITASLLTFLATFTAGLSVSRLLYEGLFPRALWLGRPVPALLLALLAALVAVRLWLRLAARWGPGKAALPFLPFVLNLTYLLQPTVALLDSRLIFGASLWAGALLIYHLGKARPRPTGYLLFLLLAVAPVYLLTLGRSVGRADTFEFQVVIPQLGIVHPTGYPLYLLLGRLFSFLPLGETSAWRINLATALYGAIALALLFLLVFRLTRRPLPALLAALALGLAPTFWSQAVEAEVYTLHALFVAGALLLMSSILLEPAEREGAEMTGGANQDGAFYLLAFLLGLGLTNHLTTVLLLPAVALTVLFAWRRQGRQVVHAYARKLLGMGMAFVIPLLLYGYLPLRWAAVNGEPMGLVRFLDWVVGGRFQGALRWDAWLSDPTRYEIVGRLLFVEWQPALLLLLAPAGLFYIWRRQWQVGLILTVTWVAYCFYALNYYVPDLAVFLLPAQLLIAIAIGLGLAALTELLATGSRKGALLPAALWLIAVAPVLFMAVERWPAVDRSQPDGRVRWARDVLALPLAEGATILADSEHFPPLYYLQQAESIRPDLRIMVLPDEAAYRSELGAQLAQGRTVYLARFLPGLEAQYHLRSVGPLVEVGQHPLQELPAGVTASERKFGPIDLLGYDLKPEAGSDPAATAVTLYWQAEEPVTEAFYVYIRWQGEDYVGQPVPTMGQHPAGNYYPTAAWTPGEIVPDYHLLPRPVVASRRVMALQVALAPPFTPPSGLAWQTVTTLEVEPSVEMDLDHALRAQVGPFLLRGAQFASQVRPASDLPLLLAGYGSPPGSALQAQLVQQSGPVAPCQATGAIPSTDPFLWLETLSTDLPSGRYELSVSSADCGREAQARAICGWLAPPTSSCVLEDVEISGVPLPAGATNFDDKIALVEVDLPETTLPPGGQLAVNLKWQALAPLTADYTVFVQVVDASDQIVGQVDSWPLQGTYPTSQWQVGEVVDDPYLVQLDEKLPAGSYRLLIGWYLLATQQRLPVLNEQSQIVDDRLAVPGLIVPALPGSD